MRLTKKRTMEIRILGAHNLESQGTRHTCFLIDDVLALDAGSLTSALTLGEQAKVSAVMVSHSHFDHVRDIPTLGLSTLWEPGCTGIYGLPETLSAIHDHFLNWRIYPDFTEGIEGAPAKFQFWPVQPDLTFPVLDYLVNPVLVPHPVPCVGYIVRSTSGASIAYTGDTAGGLKPFLDSPFQPQVLFVDITFPDCLNDLAKTTGHLTPSRLREELLAVIAEGATPPRIVAVHISPQHQDELARELEDLSREIGVRIDLGFEDMRVSLAEAFVIESGTFRSK